MTGVALLRWRPRGPYEVAFSTRLGGVSDAPYASLNLGILTGDAPERVHENRRVLCEAFGADADALVYNRQVHGVHVRRAGAADEPGDGLWTDEPGRPLLVFAADCLPIAIARNDGERPALALVHAGWKGLLAGVVAAGAEALGGGSLVAAIGPGIGPCCYEVGDEVAAPYREAFGPGILRDGRLDLWSAAEQALRAAGVAEVERTDLCTACRPGEFFSHRRDGGVTGRQGAIGVVA